MPSSLPLTLLIAPCCEHCPGVLCCAANPLHKSHKSLPRKKPTSSTGSSASSIHDGVGIQMPKPRINKAFDGRPIEDRLGDLADALNEE